MARRARGAGSVFYSEADGCWIALVSLGSRNGKRIRKKARSANADDHRGHRGAIADCSTCERAANVAAERIKREFQSGAEPMTMTLDAYMGDWLRDHGPNVRPSTLRAYQGHVEHHIGPLLGGIRVGKLTSNDVRRLISKTLAKGASPATVGRIISTLHNALDVAFREGALPRNPAKVRLPKVEREPIKPMTTIPSPDNLGLEEGLNMLRLHVTGLLDQRVAVAARRGGYGRSGEIDDLFAIRQSIDILRASVWPDKYEPPHGRRRL